MLKQSLENLPEAKPVAEARTKQEKELLQYKNRIEEEREEMHKRRLLILRTAIEKKEKEERSGGKDNDDNAGPQAEEELEHVCKEEAEIEKEFRVREEELANIKKAIELLQSQEVFKQLIAQQERADKNRAPQQTITDNFIAFRNYLVQERLKNKSEAKKEEKEDLPAKEPTEQEE